MKELITKDINKISTMRPSSRINTISFIIDSKLVKNIQEKYWSIIIISPATFL